MGGFQIAKALSIFLLSTVKFFFAPGAAVAAGFNIWETIAITSAGGITGITVFYFFGHWVFTKISEISRNSKKKESPKKIFTKRNRLIIKYRESVGLYGLVFLTPAILSIPIGCVVAAKFYYENKLTYPLLLISTILWSLGLTFFATLIKHNLI